MGALMQVPLLPVMYSPEVGSGLGTSCLLSVYSADRRPAKVLAERSPTSPAAWDLGFKRAMNLFSTDQRLGSLYT